MQKTKVKTRRDEGPKESSKDNRVRSFSKKGLLDDVQVSSIKGTEDLTKVKVGTLNARSLRRREKQL